MTAAEWNRTELEIATAMAAGDNTKATAIVERVLREGADEQKGRVLLYRGSIHEDAGEWLAAKNDFDSAVDLLPPRTYVRYTAHLSVAHACTKMGRVEEANIALVNALIVCDTSHEPFSGAAALAQILSIDPKLEGSDATLARSVARKSWVTLGLKGDPDLDDLSATAAALLQRQSAK